MGKQSQTEFLTPNMQFPVMPTLLTRLNRRHMLGFQNSSSVSPSQGVYSTGVTYFLPHYSDKARTITSLQIGVTTLLVAGNASVGVYTHSDTKGADTLIGQTNFATDTTGVKTNAVSIALPQGLSWIALRVSSATPAFNRPGANGTAGGWGYNAVGVVNVASAITTTGCYQITEAYNATLASSYTGNETIVVGNQMFPFISVLY